MTADLVVVSTGTANIASVMAAFRRLGAEPSLAGDPEAVNGAARVVLPGVGSFGAAMDELDRTRMREVLISRLRCDRATLAICVGMQLLARVSEESDGVPGLAEVNRDVSRFPETERVPQLGWNEVSARAGCQFLANGWAYFANSYRFERAPDGWAVAVSDHGGEFVAGMERGAILACQFHPELSGSWGGSILERWLDATGRGS